MSWELRTETSCPSLSCLIKIHLQLSCDRLQLRRATWMPATSLSGYGDSVFGHITRSMLMQGSRKALRWGSDPSQWHLNRSYNQSCKDERIICRLQEENVGKVLSLLRWTVKNILGENLKGIEKRTHQQRKFYLGRQTLQRISWELQNIELISCKQNEKINSESRSTNQSKWMPCFSFK